MTVSKELAAHPDLRRLLIRIQQRLGSFSEMSKRAGVRSRDTFARVARGEGSFSEETAQAFVRTFGPEEKVTIAQVRRWAHLPEPADDLLNTPPNTVMPASQIAPPYFTMVQPTVNEPPKRGVQWSAWMVKMVPLMQQRVHAGAWMAVDPEQMPVSVPRDGDFRAMRVVGECMVPRIEPGDIIIIDADAAVRPGDVAVIQRGEDMLMHRMLDRTADHWTFQADNPDRQMYPTLLVPPNEVDIIGIVVAVQKGKP